MENPTEFDAELHALLLKFRDRFLSAVIAQKSDRETEPRPLMECFILDSCEARERILYRDRTEIQKFTRLLEESYLWLLFDGNRP